MNFISIFIFLCAVIAVNAYPQNGLGTAQQYAIGMVQVKLDESQNCILETYHDNIDELLALKDELMEMVNLSKPIMESIGGADFDVEKYRESCIANNNAILKAIEFAKSKFSKCFEEDVLKIVDVAVDFMKESRDFTCNLSEEQLSYFSKENAEEVKNCLTPKLESLKGCVLDSIDSDGMNDSDETDLADVVCQIKWNQLHQCGKSVIADCEAAATDGLNLVGDFVFGFIDRHAKCDEKIEPAVLSGI